MRRPSPVAFVAQREKINAPKPADRGAGETGKPHFSACLLALNAGSASSEASNSSSTADNANSYGDKTDRCRGIGSGDNTDNRIATKTAK